jgi:hypothetical protein
MRRRLTWLLVSAGIAALVRKLRRRATETTAPATDTTSDPADELRRKLAETRSDDEEGADEPLPEASVEDRRAEVHAEGRAALDDMRPAGDD